MRHPLVVGVAAGLILTAGAVAYEHRPVVDVVAPPRPAPVTAPPRPFVADGHGWTPEHLNGPAYPAGFCHYRPTPAGVLPDPACTPGAVDPTVTQDSVDRGETICTTGYTATVRPPTSLTSKARTASALEYGVALPLPSTDEYDHLVPLELGGASDRRNLWLKVEPVLPNPKDAVERALQRMVCAHRMPLVEAQRRIALDWTTALP